MWKLLLAVGCVGPLLAAPVPKDFTKADDKTLLVGKWEMARFNVSGQEKTADNASWRLLTFDTDGRLRADTRDGRVILEYTTALDPKASPKRMTWQDKQSGEARYECVYELTAERLTIAVPHNNKVPPATLQTGPRVTIYEFKRAGK